MNRNLLALCLCLGTVATTIGAAEEHAKNPSKSFIGTWTLDFPDQYGGWLKIGETEGELTASLLWRVGSARSAKQVEVDGDKLKLIYQRKRPGDTKGKPRTILYSVRGSQTDPPRIEVTKLNDEAPRPGTSDQTPVVATGGLAPPMPPRPDLARVKFGPPIEIFNGRNLKGWSLKPATAKNGWGVKGGVLVNETPKTDFSAYGSYGNLRTNAKFKDHRLQIEFNVGKDCNSGVYVRGLYEAQVVDRDSRMQGLQGVGSIFGRIAPLKQAGRAGGEWQSYDIILIDRHITVVLNGEKVIDNQPVEGCTGGSFMGDVTQPGPLYLQGDHTSVKYRKIRIYPRVE